MTWVVVESLQRPETRMVHETVSVACPETAALTVGLYLVSPREYQKIAYRPLVKALKRASWRGTVDSLAEWLGYLNEVLRAVEEQVMREFSLRMDCSDHRLCLGIGGVARCVSGQLVAFRKGPFRVCASQQVVLQEEIEAIAGMRVDDPEMEGMPFDVRDRVVSSGVVWLPEDPLESTDFFQAAPADSPVVVFQSDTFHAPDSQPRCIEITATWKEPSEERNPEARSRRG